LQLVPARGYDKFVSMKFYFAAFAALLLFAIAARAQTTAFTYQGRLNDGTNLANGNYDFRFQIYNGGGAVAAGPLTNAPVGVTNGLFTVALDFGNVFDGTTRTLEIGVRSFGDTNAYVVLSPRQTLTSVPYAVQSLNAENLTGPLQATNIAGTIPNSLLPTNVALLTGNVNFSGSVTATNFAGNGFGLANVPATSLIGTVPDARLSANVALQSSAALNFAGSVSATNFIGAGHGLTNVPGAFFWVTVSGTSGQILPNVGYICTNNISPVTLTLPSSPSVGDVYKVAGVGAAGWIIAQNAGQNIFSGNLSESVGQSWVAVEGSYDWSAIASSADGTKLVATGGSGNPVSSGYIYTSTNSGLTWTPQTVAGYRQWSGVASSADGTTLAAVVGNGGYVYVNGNSGIGSWTQTAGSRKWTGVAMSADGTKIAAVANNDYIYTSANWSSQLGSVQNWTGIASSANGSNLVAVANGGGIYTSTNSVTTWTQRTNSGSWSAVASSSDGSRLVATINSGEIYISTDSGVTWTASSPSVSAAWTSVASSSDGSRLAAAAGSSGYIYTSSDSGETWIQSLGAPSASWTGIASSADGSQFAAVAYDGDIYVSSQSSTTTGTAGYLSGAQHSAIELIYVGNSLFLPLNHEGTIRAY
jgi:hypothetical protein